MERRSRERQALALGSEPQLTLTHRDPISGALGYLVIDTVSLGRSFVGVRIAPKLTASTLSPLARLATIRYQMARVMIGGAKCGIDYDPTAPDRLAVLERFLSAIRPYISSFHGMGPDGGLSEAELRGVLEGIGLPSKPRDWSDEAWQTYETSLNLDTEFGKMRDVRMPYFTAESLRVAFGTVLERVARPRIAIIGLTRFGLTLARMLIAQGCEVTVMADNHIGFHVPGGFRPDGIDALLQHTDPSSWNGGDSIIPETTSTVPRAELVTFAEVFSLPYDVLILANEEPRLDISHVGKVNCKVVVEAASRAVSPSAERILIDRGTLVIPNIALSLGAIVMTDAILQLGLPADAQVLLSHLGERALAITSEVVRLSKGLAIPWRDAALRVAFRSWSHLPKTWMPVA